MLPCGLGFKSKFDKKQNIRCCRVGVAEDEIQTWAQSLGCGSGTLPFIYLGLPVGANMTRASYWKPVVEKTKNKLAAWKARLIYFGGRWTLVRSVLGSVSLYHFSLFRTPVCVLKALESVRCTFWGGGGGVGREGEIERRGLAWIKWDKVLRPFNVGGLNIGGLKELNWGLIGKWWWRFHTECDALWRRVIVSIFGNDGGLGVDVSRRSGSRSVWSNIVKIGKILDDKRLRFWDSFGKKLGNGENIKFWEDRWISSGRLKDRFSRLYLFEENKLATVAKRGEFRGEEWSWKWGWRRTPRGRECGELEELCRELENFTPT